MYITWGFFPHNLCRFSSFTHLCTLLFRKMYTRQLFWGEGYRNKKKQTMLSSFLRVYLHIMRNYPQMIHIPKCQGDQFQNLRHMKMLNVHIVSHILFSQITMGWHCESSPLLSIYVSTHLSILSSSKIYTLNPGNQQQCTMDFNYFTFMRPLFFHKIILMSKYYQKYT